MAKGDMSNFISSVTPLALGGAAIYLVVKSGVLSKIGSGVGDAVGGVGSGIGTAAEGVGQGINTVGREVGDITVDVGSILEPFAALFNRAAEQQERESLFDAAAFETTLDERLRAAEQQARGRETRIGFAEQQKTVRSAERQKTITGINDFFFVTSEERQMGTAPLSGVARFGRDLFSKAKSFFSTRRGR